MTLGEQDPIDDLGAFTGDPAFSDTEPKRKGRPPGAKNKISSAPVDKAPKGMRAPKSQWSEEASVIRSLNTTIEAIGLGVGLLNKFDGNAITAGGPDLVEALVNLGRDDKRFRRYLEAMSAPGKYGPIVMATGAIALPIAANHGLFDMFSKKPSANLEPTEEPTVVPLYSPED